MKSEAPTENPRSSSSISVFDVMKITGTSASTGLAFSRRQISKPSILGIITSSRIRSGGLANAYSSAASGIADQFQRIILRQDRFHYHQIFRGIVYHQYLRMFFSLFHSVLLNHDHTCPASCTRFELHMRNLLTNSLSHHPRISI